MMRPVAALLGLLVAVPACVAQDAAPLTNSLATEQVQTSVELIPKRKLQDNSGLITSLYTAIWYFVHTGPCAGEPQPTVAVECTNGGFLTVRAVSADTECAERSSTESRCTTATNSTSTGHAVDFACVGDTLQSTEAAATILEQTTTCLGGAAASADFGHGILLGLECENQIVLNGTCDPLNTTFPDFTCTVGYTCETNCTPRDYRIDTFTSYISENDCSKYDVDPTFTNTQNSGSIVAYASILWAAVVVAMTAFFGI